MAATRVCVTRIMRGVPVGAHIEVLDCTTSGWPFDNTRVDPVIQVAVTHGPLAAMGGGSAHPATTNGAAMVTVGCALTITLGFGTVACACPPCAHSTCAPTCTRNPGMVRLLSR